MKPSVPKSGFLSKIFIGVSLAVMSACSQEAAAPAPAAEDEVEVSDEAVETRADPHAATSGAEKEGAESAPGAETARLKGASSDAAAMGPDGKLGDMALTEGEWFMKDGEALFGPPESEATFSIGCDTASGEVMMTRSIHLEPGQETLPLGLYTDTETAAGDWRDAGDVMPLGMATLPASSGIFDAIREADRFAVGAAGEHLLVLPVTEGLRQILAACT